MPSLSVSSLIAVVLAGGRSRRFGADKLAARVAGTSLLELTVNGLPADAEIVVVGPERPLQRAVRFVREEPPDGGPAAGLLAGLRAALQTPADVVLVVPGDAPDSGIAARRLRDSLVGGADQVVVGTDRAGRLQPLQLALSRAGAVQVLTAAGPAAGRNASARRLIETLEPPAARVPLPDAHVFDIDTPAALAVHRAAPAAEQVLAAVDRLSGTRPLVVALDGRSGSGKSTLAAAIALRRRAVVIPVEDFSSSSLQALTDREGNDREAGDLVVVDGIYSARPQLGDLIDLAVLVSVDPATRARRLAEGAHDAPVRQPREQGRWERAEEAYFLLTRPEESFDLHVRGEELRKGEQS